LGISRAYDFMAVAGGRITDAQLREQARDRKRKSRKKKKESTPQPDPNSVTQPPVTESSEAGVEEREPRMNACLRWPSNQKPRAPATATN
jgi:hypothetical protein